MAGIEGGVDGKKQKILHIITETSYLCKCSPPQVAFLA